jgi:hypothetical protein
MHMPASIPRDWFGRVEFLEAFAQSVVRTTLTRLQNGSLNQDLKLDAYLREAALIRSTVSSRIVTLGRAFGLPDNLLQDAARSAES